MYLINDLLKNTKLIDVFNKEFNEKFHKEFNEKFNKEFNGCI
jgi:hypothetical protein